MATQGVGVRVGVLVEVGTVEPVGLEVGVTLGPPASGSSALTITTNKTRTQKRTFTVTITGTGGGHTHSTTVSLTVK